MRTVATNGARKLRAAWLRRIRQARELTQDELAKKIGVSITAISRYERGIDAPSIDVLDRLLVTLKCWYIDLLENPDSPTPPPRETPFLCPAVEVMAIIIQSVIDEFAKPSRKPEQYPKRMRCWNCHGRPGECCCYKICPICGLPFRHNYKCSGVLHHPNQAAPRAEAC